jgi:hypothetical protein
MDLNATRLETVLSALGAHLAAEGVAVRLVVVGGAALELRALVDRTTRDVDVIARAEGEPPDVDIVPPEPLPDAVHRAAAIVARDFGLRQDWLNTEIAAQWRGGLPPGLAEDLAWHTFGGLFVGLVGRHTLIALKLFAAVDRGPRSVHFQDLRALAPDPHELEEAAAWVRTQDASADFPALVDQVVAHVLDAPSPRS